MGGHGRKNSSDGFDRAEQATTAKRKRARRAEVLRGKAQRTELPLTISRPELLVDGSDETYRRLVHGLLAFLAMHEAIRDGMAAQIGLGGIQHTILQSIRHLSARQEVNVRDVAEHLHLSGSFITIETTKLQKMGLVEKKQSTTDRRKVVLKVTKKAMALFDELAPLQRTIGDVQFGCLGRKQFQDLVPTVEQLIESSREALMLLNYLKSGDGGLRSARLSMASGRGAGVASPRQRER